MTGACLTVSQVQSIPWPAAPSSASLLLVTSVFVTSIVTRGNAAKPCTSWAAAAVGAPVSFREKETGAGWLNEMAKRIGCCRAAMKGEVAAVGTLVKVGIHHIAVTVRAAGR